MREVGIVVAPRAALRGAEEACPRDVMRDADRSASEVDVLLSHVSASAIEAVCLRMIDSRDLETLMAIGPGRRFVGVDDHALGNTGTRWLGFRLEDCRDRICRTLPDQLDNPALVLLVPGKRPPRRYSFG